MRWSGAAIALMFASFAHAATITYIGGSGPLIDESSVSFDINVGTSGTITDITVRLDLDHNQVGDLRITLSNVQPVEVVLASQFLVNQAGGATENSNYDGIYAFNDAFTGDLWTTAATVPGGTNTVVPGGAYFASTAAGVQVSLADAFVGLDTNAIWRLTITDLKKNDTGILNGWELDLTTGTGSTSVPEPSAYLLFGLGLGALASLRRRR